MSMRMGSTMLCTDGPFRIVYRVMRRRVCHGVFAHTLNLRCSPCSWITVLHARWYTHWILFIPLESSIVLQMPTFAHQIQVLVSMQCWFHTFYDDYTIDFDARIHSILDWHHGDFHNCLLPKPFGMASVKVCFLFLGERIDNLFTFDMVSVKQFPLKDCLLLVLIEIKDFHEFWCDGVHRHFTKVWKRMDFIGNIRVASYMVKLYKQRSRSTMLDVVYFTLTWCQMPLKSGQTSATWKSLANIVYARCTTFDPPLWFNEIVTTKVTYAAKKGFWVIS